MKYLHMEKGYFLSRPNRFIAHVRLENSGETVVCHVKNTGRCRELLSPKAVVYVQLASNPNRKTKYDLIAVEKGNLLINMDAQAPNQVFAEWAKDGHFMPNLTLLQGEKTWGKSRFDFYWEQDNRRGFVETKGVTLEMDGRAYFPDAPTERGVKHVEELIACKAAGYEATIFFVIQMAGMKSFSPNDATHPEFGEALRRAKSAGVEIVAMECVVSPESLVLDRVVPVIL